ncbi:MAG: hypothetical protein LBN21_12630 [Treponema sp.]|jgi:hypothetical protein|nr:hypothetical protein [Treponema sp.]
MAWVTGGKHFGAYTYEHWFDDDNKDFTIEYDKNTDDFPDNILSLRPLTKKSSMLLKNFTVWKQKTVNQ